MGFWCVGFWVCRNFVIVGILVVWDYGLGIMTSWILGIGIFGGTQKNTTTKAKYNLIAFPPNTNQDQNLNIIDIKKK